MPEFIDDTVKVSDNQCPGIFAVTYYEVPLEHGKAHIEIELSDDLGKRLLHLSSLYDLPTHFDKEFNGCKGILFRKKTYSWSGNEGSGLQLGRSCGNDEKRGVVFRCALNALCQDQKLHYEVVNGNESMFPLSYYDGILQVEALISDPSLQKMREGDASIAEFMKWMHENAKEVNTMGELARLAAKQYAAAEMCRKLAQRDKVSAELAPQIDRIADEFFVLAQESFRTLKPPKNNRMDYLVS